MKFYKIGNWEIAYNPKPIPDFRNDYDVYHEDYDGPEDNRCFTCSGWEEAEQLIKEWEEEHDD